MKVYYSAGIFNSIKSVKIVIGVKVIYVRIIKRSTDNNICEKEADQGTDESGEMLGASPPKSHRSTILNS